MEVWLVFKLYISEYSPYFPLVFAFSLFLLGCFYFQTSKKEKLTVRKDDIIDIAIVISFSLFFFLINVWNLNSWYYTSIGDEYAFWDLAKLIAKGRQFNLFSKDGVYNSIPVASSFYQASIMKLVGINYMGWKISSIVIVCLSFFPFYFLVKNLYTRLTALVAIAILSFSHYLWGYVHTGYSNIEVLFPFSFCLFYGFRAIAKKSALLFFIAGAFAGIGFYTFYSSRLTIVFLFLLIFLNRKYIPLRLSLPPSTIGFLVFFLPMLAVSKTRIITAMLERALMDSYKQPGAPPFIQQFISKTISSFASFFYNAKEGPYVTGSLLDPVSGFFLLIGLILIIANIKKYPNNFLFLVYIISTIATGGLSHYANVGVSRLNFLLPLVSMFSAVGIVKVTQVRMLKALKNFLIPVILALVLFLNLYRFNIETPRRFPASREAVTIKTTLLPVCQAKKNPPIIFERNPGGSPLFAALDSLKFSISPLLISYQDFISQKEHLSKKDACFIFVHWEDEQAQQIVYELKSKYSSLIIQNEYDYTKNSPVLFLY